MEIDVAVRSLGFYSCDQLIAKLETLSADDWQKNKLRQEKFSNVHSQTQSIILIFCDGWPNIKITREDDWQEYKSLIKPLVKNILSSNYAPGGRILRAMFAKLPPKGSIGRHVDSHPSFSIAHRIHVPLITNPQIEFIVGDNLVKTKEWHAFEINNMLSHQVTNHGETDRIHFIFDYAPSAG